MLITPTNQDAVFPTVPLLVHPCLHPNDSNTISTNISTNIWNNKILIYVTDIVHYILS